MRSMNPEIFSLLERTIDEYRDEQGDSPGLNELTGLTGLPQTTVYRYLERMKASGVLESSGRKNYRTERTAKQNLECVSVPVVGTAKCGPSICAEQNIEQIVRLPVALFGREEFFFLKTQGESMTGAGIQEGDLVLVRRSSSAESGQVIVALVGGEEIFLKRYFPDPKSGTVRLVPDNPDFPVRTVDLSLETFSVQGIVVKVIHDIQ